MDSEIYSYRSEYIVELMSFRVLNFIQYDDGVIFAWLRLGFFLN